MTEPIEEEEQQEPGFIAHLTELRNRLLKIVVAVIVVMLALLPFGNELYTLLADPLLKHLPEGSSMIAIDVAAPFFIPFKLVMMVAVFATVPYILYHVWAFVAPGLYRKEKRLAFPLLVSSVLLFYLGVAFAYFLVFPIVFAFIIGMAPEGVAVMTDIGRYLDFVIALFFAFGAAFEIPVATVLLVAVGITTPQALAEKRPYVIVGAFVIGMLLTPPDVVSQTLLAIPMWLLYELGIFASKLVLRQRGNVDVKQEADS
jgi:sec-independent protein translocase protein TatC